MKILILTLGCHPETSGGIQTFTRCLKKMFYNNIVFLSFEPLQERYFKTGDIIEIKRLNIIFKVMNKLVNNLIDYYKVKSAIKKIDHDIVLLNFPNDLEYTKKEKSKKILVQHTSFDVYFKRYYCNNEKLLERSKKELDYFVVLSEYDKLDLINKLAFPIEKIRVIRHSCELKLRQTNKEKSRKLVMIARLTQSKRFDLVINAMDKLKDFTLEIYGEGTEEEKYIIQELIKEKKFKNVKFCGVTNNVKEVLDRNGIFVMASDFEGYPITNIEAMRRGLPIILRNTFSAASDIIKENGILLEKEWNENKFCDAVKHVYENYEKYSQNSIKLGKRYDNELIKNEWKNLFLELCDEK